MAIYVFLKVKYETSFQSYGGESLNKCNSKVPCASITKDLLYIIEISKLLLL